MGKTALLGYAAVAARAAEMMVLGVTGVEWESDLAFAGLHGLLWPIVDELEGVPAPQPEPLAAALRLAPGEGRDRFLVSAWSTVAAGSRVRNAADAVPGRRCAVARPSIRGSFAARSRPAPGRRGGGDPVRRAEGERRRFDDLRGWMTSSWPASTADRRAGCSITVRPGQRRPSVSGCSTRRRETRWRCSSFPGRFRTLQLAGEAPLPGALPMTSRLRGSISQADRSAGRRHSRGASDCRRRGGGRAGRHAARRGRARAGPGRAGYRRGDRAGADPWGATRFFRYPLGAGRSVYESATLSQRQRTHAALAAALEGENSAERAVWHRAMAALSPDDEVAASLGPGVGPCSVLRGGHASAASAFERAATLSGTLRATSAWWTCASAAQARAGRPDRAIAPGG